MAKGKAKRVEPWFAEGKAGEVREMKQPLLSAQSHMWQAWNNQLWNNRCSGTASGMIAFKGASKTNGIEEVLQESRVGGNVIKLSVRTMGL